MWGGGCDPLTCGKLISVTHNPLLWRLFLALGIRYKEAACPVWLDAQPRGEAWACLLQAPSSLSGQRKDTLPSPKTGWSYPAQSAGQATPWGGKGGHQGECCRWSYSQACAPSPPQLD